MASLGVRTAAFVDGLNLYHGLRDEGLLKFRWLDVEGMVDSLAADAGGPLEKSLDVTRVVYCTSMVANKQAARRQDLYLQALEQHCPRVEILKGSYQEKMRECADCGADVGFQTEKQTDVNLAVEMVKDAARPAGQRSDVQLLLTGDTDLLPAISAVRSYGVEVVAIAPPSRAHARESFTKIASIYLRVRRRHLSGHPLPDPVLRPRNNGDVYPLRPPNGWMPPSDW